MKQIMLRRWLGVVTLGSAIVLGCSHAGHQCTNCMMGGTAEPPRVSSSEMEGEVLTPVVHTSTELSLAETKVEVRKLDLPHGSVLTPVVGPGGVVGTVEMSSRDAEAIGIKPGRTPGMVVVPENMPLPR